MTRLGRIVVVLLMLALPLQGAMAASRHCMPATADAAAPALGSVHAVGHGAESGHAHPTGDEAPIADHSPDSCKHCAACSLTVAIAPAVSRLVAADASFPGYRPIVVPVPHNVADGLERPPRTI